MNDPTIICPQCKTPIKLTESLAAPLLESTKALYEKRLSEKDAEIQKRENSVKERESALSKERETFEDKVTERVTAEKVTIAAGEAKKAQKAVADQIAKLQEDKQASDELARDRDEKLAEARKNELQLRQERQQLQDEKEKFELTKQRAIDEARAGIKEAAQKDADERAHLKIADRDKTISDLQGKLQEALRKAEQGSQQLQGEVQELEVEALVRSAFPTDLIEPVPKGEYGGDIIQRVIGPAGQQFGTMLWESKRTKNWQDGWLPKLRDNQRAAKAEIALIVTQCLPKEVDSFKQIDGVWVTSHRCAIPVAAALRHLLIEVATARTSREGQQTKMEMIYQYLTGPAFRHRIEAIAEKFNDMQEDLEKERKAITKQWAKREEQIRGVIAATAGMYGDLQGIAGKSLQEIDGFDIKLLSESTPEDSTLPATSSG